MLRFSQRSVQPTDPLLGTLLPVLNLWGPRARLLFVRVPLDLPIAFMPLTQNLNIAHKTAAKAKTLRRARAYKPTRLSRDDLWAQLFVTKHRANPYQGREYQGADRDEVYERWYQEQRYIGAYKVIKPPFCIDIDVAMVGFNIDNVTAFFFSMLLW